MVGGGPVAARKARVLLDYGPQVVVCAPRFVPELEQLSGPELRLCPFSPELLEGISLAIAATDQRALNHRIGALCRARSIPVNVADSREESTFLFPAVLRRGPLSVGISTGGSSPAAAAWVRRTLEDQLPPLSGAHSGLAGGTAGDLEGLPAPARPGGLVHPVVLRRPGGRPPFDRGGNRVPPAPVFSGGESMTENSGRVYLVGAGCGPAEWITLQGYRLLQSCDAVVYDDLIAPELLDAAPLQAQKIYMGKRLGRRCAAQAEISQTLIALAQAGKAVVRLKGGDPFVFGRGGEEVQALQAAGIPFEVVPGISSAIAIPGQAGIPVTHRGVSRSFHVVTAHTKDGSSDQLDALAGAEGTLE